MQAVRALERSPVPVPLLSLPGRPSTSPARHPASGVKRSLDESPQTAGSTPRRKRASLAALAQAPADALPAGQSTLSTAQLSRPEAHGGAPKQPPRSPGMTVPVAQAAMPLAAAVMARLMPGLMSKPTGASAGGAAVVELAAGAVGEPTLAAAGEAGHGRAGSVRLPSRSPRKSPAPGRLPWLMPAWPGAVASSAAAPPLAAQADPVHDPVQQPVQNPGARLPVSAASAGPATPGGQQQGPAGAVKLRSGQGVGSASAPPAKGPPQPLKREVKALGVPIVGVKRLRPSGTDAPVWAPQGSGPYPPGTRLVRFTVNK